MVILLDVDGVIADFVGLSLRCLGSRYRENQVTSHDICNALSLSVAEREYLEGHWRSRMFPELIDPYPGSVTFVNQLRELGDVYCVTAPMEGSEYWQSARQKWLEDHFGLTDVVSTKHKYLVQGDVMIDDQTTNLAFSLCPKKILLARPWNTPDVDYWGITVAHSYAQILEQLSAVRGAA